ncbi:glycosyltransferase family 39 protein [Echinicola sp. CAU 1574]|uniref:Glycosyltransferase family 39 protein n=1 Tax=Echinicola arenosa TaxID=2774144 RepID=A0ABR9AEM9_9BACT|nr:glycosyltransferase family 39 protein [Echinicola arenosa]MBD8487121.1 glycosyltransferase family 39 protein [Echinicola arenosa]
MKLFPSFSLQQVYILILSLGFILVNLVLYSKLGVMEDSDTDRYLIYAQEIQERGIFFKPHEFWYIAYPIFIISMTSIYDSLAMVVVGQLLLSYLALLSVYASAKRLHGNSKAGLLAGLAFVAFFMISYWNFEIYCESLLISLNCLAFHFILLWSEGKRESRLVILGVLIIGVAVFTKPTGVALLAAVFAFLVVMLWPKLKGRSLKLVLVTFGAVSILVLTNFMLSTFTFVRDYQVGEIIYNLEVLPFEEHEAWLKLDVPENLYIPDDSLPPLVQLLLVILMNPWYAMKLMLAKLFYYLFYLRPYYSWKHNLFMIVILVPMYIGFFKGMFSEKLRWSIKVVVGVFLVVSILSPVLMTIDWRNRFLVAVLPWIFMVGSGYLAQLRKTEV